MSPHTLKIIALHDAQAECSCGEWFMGFTGRMERKEIERRHREHCKAKRYVPQIGDYIHPDTWKTGEILSFDDGYRDSSFPGCQFRVELRSYALAVNITVTGNDYPTSPYWAKTARKWKCRCKIEFVGDGEPSQFVNGWLFHD